MMKFDLTPVAEVQLHRGPLAKVLMQVRYSRTPLLVTDGAEAVIAEALGRYPVRRRQVTVGMVPDVVINGAQLQVPGSIAPGVALLFTDPSGGWQATVTDTAVALETTDYSTRADFCERAGEIFAAVAAVALPPVVDRVGIRYIDRLTGPAVEQVPSYVIPELAGLVGCVDGPLGLHHSITESQLEIGPNERMLVRSGLLPAGSSFDPALQPIGEPNWVLDMDVFTTHATYAFEPDELTQRLRRYAEATYSFFRYATTEAFQHAYGVEPVPAAGEQS